MSIAKLNTGVHPTMDELPIQGGVEILLVASCYRNRRYGPVLARMQKLPFIIANLSGDGK